MKNTTRAKSNAISKYFQVKQDLKKNLWTIARDIYNNRLRSQTRKVKQTTSEVSIANKYFWESITNQLRSHSKRKPSISDSLKTNTDLVDNLNAANTNLPQTPPNQPIVKREVDSQDSDQTEDFPIPLHILGLWIGYHPLSHQCLSNYYCLLIHSIPSKQTSIGK